MNEKVTYKGKTYDMLHKLIEDHPNFSDGNEDKIIIESTMKSITNQIKELANDRANEILDEIRDKLEESNN